MTSPQSDLSPNLVNRLPAQASEQSNFNFANNYSAGNSSPLEIQEHPIKHYYQVLVRRFWIFFTVTTLIIGIVAAYSFLSQRLYTATVSLKIGTYAPALPGDGAEDIFRAKSLEQDYLNTQVEQLNSLSVANMVLTKDGIGPAILAYLRKGQKTSSSSITEKTLDTVGYDFPLKVLKRYLGLIHIDPVFKTSLARISATTADPALSARIANAHAQAFIEYARTERQRVTFDNLTFLSGQAKDLEDRVAKAERGIGEYSEQNSLITLDTNENLVVKQIAELNRKLSDASAHRVKVEAALNEAKTGSGLKSSALDDDAIRNLRIELNSLEAEYAMMSSKFSEAYPKMGQVKARLIELRKRLKDERQGSVDALEARYKSALAAEEELKKQLEALKTQAFEVSRKQVQLHVMHREFESLKDLHQSVLRQLKEVQISAENPSSNIIVTEVAAIPDTPASPKRALNMMLALGFGPIIGFLLVLLVESMDTSIKSVAQIRSYLGLPLLGVIPKFIEHQAAQAKKLLPQADVSIGDTLTEPGPGESGNLPDAPLVTNSIIPKLKRAKSFVTVSDPRSAAAEAFQSVRTSLLLSTPERAPQIVLVTSANKSEGKTTLVSNLAITMAQSGGRTILIDCDLRRPSLSERFGVGREANGLVDYLTGNCSLEQILIQSKVPNLTLVAAGALSPNPAALIGSKRMAELLHNLSQTYDYVLLDSPPLLPVADALMLSRMGAGVVLVVHSRDSQRKMVQEAQRRLHQANAVVHGVVLNHADQHSDEYYSYESYYSDSKGVVVVEKAA